MFGWVKKFVAWMKGPQLVKCSVCDFEDETQELVDAHEKECHPVTTAALAGLRQAGHTRHGITHTKDRTYVELPPQTFSAHEALGLEPTPYPGPLTDPVPLTEQVVKEGFEGFGGGLSGGAGASGEWKPDPTSDLDPDQQWAQQAAGPPPLPGDAPLTEFSPAPDAPTNGDLSETSLGSGDTVGPAPSEDTDPGDTGSNTSSDS